MPREEAPVEDSGCVGRCSPPFADKPRLRRWEAAQYLMRQHGIGIAPSTLAKYATVGGGPRFQKAGRIPLYPVDELNLWAAEKLGAVVGSTSAR